MGKYLEISLMSSLLLRNSGIREHSVIFETLGRGLVGVVDILLIGGGPLVGWLGTKTGVRKDKRRNFTFIIREKNKAVLLIFERKFFLSDNF